MRKNDFVRLLREQLRDKVLERMPSSGLWQTAIEGLVIYRQDAASTHNNCFYQPHKVGVAGYGGLGHMAVQYLVKLGADVTVFDITEEKRADALKMGVKEYVNVNHPEELKNQNGFDLILSTIPTNYDPLMYARMLKRSGELVILGNPADKDRAKIDIGAMLPTNRRINGSLVGEIKETQEMLDYSIANDIYPVVEIIPATGEAVTKAYPNVVDGKVKFRYVIDMQTLE